MQISINPATSQWVSIAIAIAGGLAALTPSAFPSYIPSQKAMDVIQTAGFVSLLGGIIEAALHRYSSSEPGPGAPPDPPAVKAVVLQQQKADLDKQIEKVNAVKAILLLAALSLAALLAPGGSQAVAKAHGCIPFPQCQGGWKPSPKPAPAPAPIPSPSGAVPSTGDIIGGITQFQAQVVADLQQADDTQAAPLNAATGAAWNPPVHMCLAGLPASGTPDQPGYIPPSIGLIAWIQGLNPVSSTETVPPLPANPSAATLAVNAANKLLAAQGDVNNLVNQITSGGFPPGLLRSCGGLLNAAANEFATIGNQVLVIDAMLAKYVMPVVAAEKKKAMEKKQ